MKQIISSAFFFVISGGKLPGSYAHTLHREKHLFCESSIPHIFTEHPQILRWTTASDLQLLDKESKHSEMGAVTRTGKSPWLAASPDRECCCCCVIPVWDAECQMHHSGVIIAKQFILHWIHIVKNEENSWIQKTSTVRVISGWCDNGTF